MTPAHRPGRLARYRQRLAAELLPMRRFEAARWQGPATLSVTCDDGFARDYGTIAPLLEALGLRGSFAVCAELLGRPGYMSEAQVADLARRGHGIACHMLQHEPLPSLPPARLADALQQSRRWLGGFGAEGAALVYPYGASSRRVRALAVQHFQFAMSAWPGINVGRVNRFALQRVAFGSYEHPGFGVAADPQRWVEQLVRSSGWMILMLHSGHDAHGARQDAQLERLLLDAKARGVALEHAEVAARRLQPAAQSR